jgi:transcriptional regulator NrdR family protein
MAMKCPECGANAECNETRRWKSENKTRRTYECFGCPKTKQIHKFNTYETIAGSIRPKPALNKVA